MVHGVTKMLVFVRFRNPGHPLKRRLTVSFMNAFHGSLRQRYNKGPSGGTDGGGPAGGTGVSSDFCDAMKAQRRTDRVTRR